MNPDSKTNSALWYYAHEGTTLGPVAFETLQEMLHAGSVTTETLVTREGLEDWQPLSAYLTEQRPHNDASGQETTTAAAREPTPQKASNTETAFGCGCMLVIALLLGFFVKSCFFDNASGHTPEDKKNPSNAVQKLMERALGSKLSSTKTFAITDTSGPARGKFNVHVHFVEPYEGHAATKAYIELDMAKAYKELFTSRLPLWEVTLFAEGKLQDRYGNESNDLVYKTTLGYRQAVKINWKNFDSVDFRQLWEVNFMLPSFSALQGN